MKFTILPLAAAAALVLAAQPADAAKTKVRPSDELNRQQLAQFQQDMAARQEAQATTNTNAWGATATTDTTAAPSLSYANPAQTTDGTTPGTDTNPQSAGMATTNAPATSTMTTDPSTATAPEPGTSPATDNSAAQVQQ